MTLLSDPRLMRWIELAGGLYVIWIGVQFLRAARLESAVTVEEGMVPRCVGFIDGAVVLLLNAKAYVIIIIIFTQFLAPCDDRFGAVFFFTLNNLIAFII